MTFLQKSDVGARLSSALSGVTCITMRTPALVVVAGMLLALSTSSCSSGPSQKAHSNLVPPGQAKPAKIWTKEIWSRPYHIDKKYMSMKGPDSLQYLQLLEGDEPELLWIVGYEARMVNKDRTAEVSQEFMCHSNLDFDAHAPTGKRSRANASMSGRLFTLSQGQQNSPTSRKGTGIPDHLRR